MHFIFEISIYSIWVLCRVHGLYNMNIMYCTYSISSVHYIFIQPWLAFNHLPSSLTRICPTLATWHWNNTNMTIISQSPQRVCQWYCTGKLLVQVLNIICNKIRTIHLQYKTIPNKDWYHRPYVKQGTNLLSTASFNYGTPQQSLLKNRVKVHCFQSGLKLPWPGLVLRRGHGGRVVEGQQMTSLHTPKHVVNIGKVTSLFGILMQNIPIV